MRDDISRDKVSDKPGKSTLKQLKFRIRIVKVSYETNLILRIKNRYP